MVDVCGADSSDISGHRRHPGQLVVPGFLDRFPRQRKRGHRRGDESRCVVGIAAAVSRDCPRLGEQRGVKELPAREEGLHSGA